MGPPSTCNGGPLEVVRGEKVEFFEWSPIFTKRLETCPNVVRSRFGCDSRVSYESPGGSGGGQSPPANAGARTSAVLAIVY